MELIEARELDKEKYNHFVSTNDGGSFLQSWEWGEWQKNLGRQAHRFFLTGNNQLKTNNFRSDDIIGIIQLVQMPLPFGKFYWYAPYGPVTNLRFKIEDLRFLIQGLQKQFPGAVFIRFEPKVNISFISHPLSFIKTTNIQPGKTLIIDISKSEEQLLAEMHPKTRYNIKLAQKHGVKIEDEFDINIGHGLFYEEALQLIELTSTRQKYKSYSLAYLRQLIDFFIVQNRGVVKLHIYKALYNNQLLACAIMLDFGKTRTFLFGGSSSEYKNLMAPYLLHFQAMLDAQAQNLYVYDFWGVETSGGQTPGFVRFKLGFAGEVREYGGAYDLVNNMLGYWLYNLFRKINRWLR